MKLPIISREQCRKEAEAAGATPLPKDHPLRFEGSSIMFLSRTRKPSAPKDNDSARNDTDNDSD